MRDLSCQKTQKFWIIQYFLLNHSSAFLTIYGESKFLMNQLRHATLISAQFISSGKTCCSGWTVLRAIMIKKQKQLYAFSWCTERNLSKWALESHFISVESSGHFKKGEIPLSPIRHRQTAFQMARGIHMRSIKSPEKPPSQSNIIDSASAVLRAQGREYQELSGCHIFHLPFFHIQNWPEWNFTHQGDQFCPCILTAPKGLFFHNSPSPWWHEK